MDHDDALMLKREADRDAAVAKIAQQLNLIEYRATEPDPWERAALGHAIAAVFAGFYDLAMITARLAGVLPKKRSSVMGLAYIPAFDRYDLAFLSNALERAQLEPVKRYPQLGPIEIK